MCDLRQPGKFAEAGRFLTNKLS